MKKHACLFLFFAANAFISCTKDSTSNSPSPAIVSKSGKIFAIAGTGASGYSGNGVPATQATLWLPWGVTLDSQGNIYFADVSDNLIRKINTHGIILVIAGNPGMPAGYSGDGGTATAAALYNPAGVAVDNSGNVYFSDCVNQRIRMVNTSGIISTIAGNGTRGYSGDGGAAAAAEFYFPCEIAIDHSGNLYIADVGNNCIRCINSSGIISTIAGNGTAAFSGDGGAATAAELNAPSGVKVDINGNIYIADQMNNRIRKVNTSGVISTIAGTGTAGYSGDGGAATAAMLWDPADIAFDGSGNIYISDLENALIRVVNTSGVISTIAGTRHYSNRIMGGLADTTYIDSPEGIAIDDSNNIYFANRTDNMICKIYK